MTASSNTRDLSAKPVVRALPGRLARRGRAVAASAPVHRTNAEKAGVAASCLVGRVRHRPAAAEFAHRGAAGETGYGVVAELRRWFDRGPVRANGDFRRTAIRGLARSADPTDSRLRPVRFPFRSDDRSDPMTMEVVFLALPPRRRPGGAAAGVVADARVRRAGGHLP
ncbi:hypothetical protein ACWEFJ_37815 [Actinosynnema sp. NPDC004786]